MLEIKRKIYDDKDWYEEYIQVLKDGKEIHYGESFELPKYENGNHFEELKGLYEKAVQNPNVEQKISYQLNMFDKL